MNTQDIVLKGIPISRGIAIGRPLFLSNSADSTPRIFLTEQCIQDEITRYRNALELSREDIKHLQKELRQEGITEGAAILEAHLQIMYDPLLTTSVEDEIQTSRCNADAILHTLLKKYQKKFNSLKNPFFKERFKDIEDIIQRVLRHLHASIEAASTHTYTHAVIFSKELTVTETAEAHIACASAFVTERGSATSHAAIVAKARGTPYVSSIPWTQLTTYSHEMTIVDGRTGEIILNPSQETLQRYEQMRQKLQHHAKKLSEVENLPSTTLDGTAIRLSANVEIVEDLSLLHQYKGHGVGIYRSEYMCLSKDRFPTEQEQYETYCTFLSNMHGLPFIIRTFDMGGDKAFPGQQVNQETNPLLGYRAIRFFLKERALFKTQLRAILRAGADQDVDIMFPMVSTLTELRDAKEILLETERELAQEGVDQPKRLRIGCMIEVPAAAIIADLLAQECDFLSIGTNDLVQHVLAVDRECSALNNVYTPSHPSILRLIKSVAQEAATIPISVCGEIAADPRFTELLLGLGIRELSVATRYIPTIRHAIRCVHMEEAQQLAKEALALKTSTEIQELLFHKYHKKIPDDYFYNIMPF